MVIFWTGYVIINAMYLKYL